MLLLLLLTMSAVSHATLHGNQCSPVIRRLARTRHTANRYGDGSLGVSVLRLQRHPVCRIQSRKCTLVRRRCHRPPLLRQRDGQVLGHVHLSVLPQRHIRYAPHFLDHRVVILTPPARPSKHPAPLLRAPGPHKRAARPRERLPGRIPPHPARPGHQPREPDVHLRRGVQQQRLRRAALLEIRADQRDGGASSCRNLSIRMRISRGWIERRGVICRMAWTRRWMSGCRR